MPPKRFFNAGDWLHVVQIAILLGTLGVYYQKFVEINDSVNKHSNMLERVEHYLSSQDPQYWRKAHENGDR